LEESRHRRLEALGRHLDPYQALGPPRRRGGHEVVGFLAAEAACPRDPEGLDHPAARRHLGKRLELAAAEELADVLQLQTEAQVGLVRAESLHGLREGQPRERARQLDAAYRLE